MKKPDEYPLYKDSKAVWIGNIPNHWEIVKVKHIFFEKKKEHNIKLNCGAISFGKVVKKADDKIPLETKKAYQVIQKGDFLINPLNLNYDLKSLRTALSDLNVVVSSGYIVLDSKPTINKSYFKWLLHRFDVAYMKTLGSGVRQTINYSDIGNSLLVEPPIEEQQAIVNSIEENNQKIDKAINLQEQQIRKLREYKESLIDSVVTGKVRVI